MAPLKPPPPPLRPGESGEAYRRRITVTSGEPTEELQLAPKKERHFTEVEKLWAKAAGVAAIVSSVFGAGWVANERVGKVLVEQIAIKEEQRAQRELLLQAVTKEYFSWKMEQASDACYSRAIARIGTVKVPVLCPKFPTRGLPYVCHFSIPTATQ